jgi:uncharacterized protein YcbK (DUF882 family)
MFGANDALQNASAEGDTRTLSFHHLHTGEDITVIFKRNGRYDDAALKKLDWFMRDWRKEKSTRMDPHLFDLLWEAYREVGATQPIDVVCGYRSPETNSMLRRRSSGVAQFSQHINGQAMDFFIPGVPLEKIREVGLRLQRGGVGFYPTSGSPFVHMDTGTIRHWPRMTHDQLAKVFPDGRTVHIPSDGQPLRGYSLALADVERRGGRPSETSLEAAREAGVVSGSRTRNFFARLFGRGKDADESNEDSGPTPDTATKDTRAPVAVASVTPPKPKAVAVETIVPLPTARPATNLVASSETKPSSVGAVAVKPASYSFVTASLGADLFDNRGYWRGAIQNGPDLPTVVTASTKYQTASVDPASTGTTALAYAGEPGPSKPAQPRPMGARVMQQPAEAVVVASQGNTTIVEKPALTAASADPALNSPWLRAAMLTPSVTTHMSATRIGAVDMRPLQEMLYKPSHSLAISFSSDPNLGLMANRFSGPAVVFLATTTFTTQSTAAFAMHTTAFR